MAEFKTIKLKRLWNNLASTRDYIIDECIEKGLGIRFEVFGSPEFMEISCENLQDKSFQTNKTLQKSRFSKDYYLVDFAWRPLNKVAPPPKPKKLDYVKPEYLLTEDSIQCMKCFYLSHNENDIRFKYCGNCHKYHKSPEG